MKIHTGCFSKQILQGHWIEPFPILGALINEGRSVSTSVGEDGIEFNAAFLLWLFSVFCKALNTWYMDSFELCSNDWELKLSLFLRGINVDLQFTGKLAQSFLVFASMYQSQYWQYPQDLRTQQQKW